MRGSAKRLLDLGTFEHEHRRLHPEFGARGRRFPSLLSKVAAFLAPYSFNAWDRYARRGVNLAYGRAGKQPFADYVSYLVDVNRLLDGEAGTLARRACPHWSVAKVRRVLDVSLMRLGGRWGEDRSPPECPNSLQPTSSRG